MTLIELVKKIRDREDPVEIRRKSWLEHPDQQTCVFSLGDFYKDCTWDEVFPFDAEDILADDWEYSETIWRNS